jgi:hypothetical protein
VAPQWPGPGARRGISHQLALCAQLPIIIMIGAKTATVPLAVSYLGLPCGPATGIDPPLVWHPKFNEPRLLTLPGVISRTLGRGPLLIGLSKDTPTRSATTVTDSESGQVTVRSGLLLGRSLGP